jgi:hypothetical protein
VKLADSIAGMQASPPPPSQLNPLIAIYKDSKSKTQWANQPGLEEEETEAYRRVATISGASKHWVAKGSIGMMI